MKEEEEEIDEQRSSRREFIFMGVGLGVIAVAAAAGSGVFKFKGDETDLKSTKVKVLTTDGKLLEVEASLLKDPTEDLYVTREASRHGIAGRKFVMVIDLGKCKNARKCVEACQAGHHLTKDQEWMRVYLLQESSKEAPFWFPRPCFHCDSPMCASVCPVGATYKRSDGIVLIDNERCIGCKFCMTGCPYSVRVFNWDKPPSEDLKIPYSPETNLPGKEGTVGKCVFCADKLRQGELPRCVQACPMGVIYFGDVIEDTVTNGTDTVKFSDLIKDKAAYRYLESLGTEPSVYYLPPTDRQFPVERGLEGIDEEVKERYKNTNPYELIQRSHE